MTSLRRPALRLAGLALALAGGLMATPTARAGLTIPDTTVVPVHDPDYQYMFHVVLTAGSQIKKGDYFTVYDFPDLIPDSDAEPDNWVFSSGGLGQTPLGVSVPDDPTLPNATWTYFGTVPLVGPQDVGIFSVISHFLKLTPFYYSYQVHDLAGNLQVGSGTTTPRLVPEPSSLALAGLGLIGLAWGARRRTA